MGPLPGRRPGVTGPGLAEEAEEEAAVGLGFEFFPLDFLDFVMAPVQADTPGMNSTASGFRALGSGGADHAGWGVYWLGKVIADAETITGAGWKALQARSHRPLCATVAHNPLKNAQNCTPLASQALTYTDMNMTDPEVHANSFGAAMAPRPMRQA